MRNSLADIFFRWKGYGLSPSHQADGCTWGCEAERLQVQSTHGASGVAPEVEAQVCFSLLFKLSLPAPAQVYLYRRLHDVPNPRQTARNKTLLLTSLLQRI